MDTKLSKKFAATFAEQRARLSVSHGVLDPDDPLTGARMEITTYVDEIRKVAPVLELTDGHDSRGYKACLSIRNTEFFEELEVTLNPFGPGKTLRFEASDLIRTTSADHFRDYLHSVLLKKIALAAAQREQHDLAAGIAWPVHWTRDAGRLDGKEWADCTNEKQRGRLIEYARRSGLTRRKGELHAEEIYDRVIDLEDAASFNSGERELEIRRYWQLPDDPVWGLEHISQDYLRGFVEGALSAARAHAPPASTRGKKSRSKR